MPVRDVKQLPGRPAARGRAGRTRSNPVQLTLAALLFAFFAVFLVWPILQVVAGGFVRPGGGVTVGYVALVFQDPVLRGGLLNAVLIAVLVTALSLLISMPLAVLFGLVR